MNPTTLPRRRLWLALAAALSLPLSGCLDDHGHAHDENGEHIDASAADATHDEPPMRAVTTWSRELELFMEFPAPTAGMPGKYITHLTHLDDFSPVMSGPLRYRFERDDGHVEEHVAETIARDGIFLPEIRVEKPGHYQLDLILGTGDDALKIGVGHVTVTAPGEARATDDDHGHDHGDEGHEDHHGDEAGDIAFLKEQQWRMDFAVQQAFQDFISERLSVPARIEPRPGQSAEAAAPAGGRLVPPESGEWKRPGDRVEAGDVLARVLPLSGAEDVSLLDLDLTEARERVSLARAERDRVQRLFDDGVVSEKRLEKAQSEYRIAQQALERASTRLGQLEGERDQSTSAVALRAPIGGVITASPRAAGEVVAANEPVFSLLDDSRVWLRAMAYPGDMARIERPGNLLARQAGGQWQRLPGAELAYVGTRTEENGTVPLVFDVPNPDGRLIPGTAWSAAFSTGSGQMAIVVPRAAILDDDGIAVVIVQHGGERFERRQVETGIRSGDRVAITAGLQAGERVVTQGAYTVLLASRGEQEIGHGHAH
ncbi:efflux RND transporter periplasmic adaptor subunit [Guyparkeria hydrothermalis]|uniref:efflux RND transporter periplasmic adaptor subunit n=1 Tax=Guyparkeria hydrothermalis TaxID=923 RepID=UPI0020221D21|nr:efflux RND transporter periplasmic adaptor subunit [Guyparkeria hydrothermalis]MCL7751387.1 efflux RND transporter periplasmic adaptor subunit [Guyparkeria hydrothermalis]